MALLEPVPVGERYLLVRRLATGGVADIFLARQSATAGFEKEVVIKRLRPELRGNSRVVKMFLEEARIGALLNHPNVVHVYDVDVADGAPYIAMEYIVGGELGTLCRRGLAQKTFLPLPHAVELVRQAAAGLGYLHAKRGPEGQALGIVHRDVSPNNLLVTEDGFLKIIDFGIAKTRRSDGSADRVLPGKLSYLSPEQVAREPVDPRTDIFSLGVVLYEITLGRRLFKGPAHDVVRRISEYAIEPPTFVRRGYPAALEAIVMRALARRPADRYESAYDLADDLDQFLHTSKLASGPVQIARYLDELGHAEGGIRRPELRGQRPDTDNDTSLFSGFRAAPGREWDDAEEPIADVASALGIDVAELRAMRVPPPDPVTGSHAALAPAELRAGPAARQTLPRVDAIDPVIEPVIAPVIALAPAPVPPAAAPMPAAPALVERDGDGDATRPAAASHAVPDEPSAAGATLTSTDVDHEAADHEAADHEAAEPEAADHEAADHEAADHEAADHGAVDQEVADKAATEVVNGAILASQAAAPEARASSVPPRAARSHGELAEVASRADFGAAFLHRAGPARPPWLWIAIIAAVILIVLFIVSS